MNKQQHNANIKEQFTKQAAAYTSVKAHTSAIDILIQMSGVKAGDNVIDIACGSGIVSCEFAKHAHHVTGVDITESMLEQARALQKKNNLNNIDWVLDDVLPLAFEDDQFTIAVSRFGFHHFIEYGKVFEEMIRVCKPGGKVMFVDVALPKEKRDAYDEMEKLRDNSHVSALTVDELDELFHGNKRLMNCQSTSYEMCIDLETQLKASFPNEGDKDKLYRLVTEDAGKDLLGVKAQWENGIINLYYPIHIYVGEKR